MKQLKKNIELKKSDHKYEKKIQGKFHQSFSENSTAVELWKTPLAQIQVKIVESTLNQEAIV